MDAIFAFFENMSSPQKLGWIVLCLTISSAGESIIPFIKADFKRLKHALFNLVFLGTTVIINVLFGILTVGVFAWLNTNEFGLLYLIDLPVLVELLLAIMLLDFIAQFVAHYLLHKVKWMWKFHLVHHSDLMVTATSGTRHHPGDYLMRECFALFAIVIGGVPVAFYIIYRLCSVMFTYFNHANIKLPNVIDKLMSFVFVTPDMHKFHHHFERPWTDSNFGNIFSFWDRIFGTLVYDDPSKIRYGVDVLEDETATDLAYQFKMPFNKDIKTDY